ncbi:uncharacterized protein LOC123499362 isoform X3 [Portunus trituberculatus]|uniref:uncharacterized protein LOC123499362 isoform X3 n=1 Tax=Portunus trituberculatus TaxID=210409 RepID=UPI001E1D141C|nr:uncharacterized protein LOC123499362 isoform X3 [Portunus trituberculatus]
MAERRSVVVRSSKRSAIKKVEVITVVGNNVASVTASHPVGVVVAERRRGPPAGGEPRPVFIPGCPLPQVLATEVAVDLEVTRGGQRPAHRPLKTGTCGLGSHAGPPKSAECRQTVTDDSENKENYPRDKIYDPRVYVDSLPKDSDEQFEQKPSGLHSGSDAENTTDSSQNSDSSVQFGQRCPSPPSAGDMEEVEEGLPRESSHTGPPRYVLLHGGAAQTHHSCSEGREALERESQETSTESSQENQKVTIHNSDMTSKDTGSSSWDSVARKKQAGKSSVSSVETDEIAIGGSECQHQTPANLKTKDQPARVIQVKRGSLSIRTKPHELRHSARGGCRSVSVVSSGARGRGRGVRVLHRGTGGAMSTVRRTHPQVTGGASRTEGSRSRPSRMDGRLGASDERKGQRGRNGSVGVIHPPDATSPRKQPLHALAG